MGLYTNSAGQPGTLMESWSVTIPAIFPAPLTALSSVLNPALSSGTQYWFVIGQMGDGTPLWHENDRGITGGVWLGGSINALAQFGPNVATPAIQLTSLDAAVPEPGSAVLLGFGCAAVLALLQRRRQP